MLASLKVANPLQVSVLVKLKPTILKAHIFSSTFMKIVTADLFYQHLANALLEGPRLDGYLEKACEAAAVTIKDSAVTAKGGGICCCRQDKLIFSDGYYCNGMRS